MLTFVSNTVGIRELGMDYQVEYYQRSPSYAAPEIQTNHPLGKAPILVDDEM
jgi:glutathione S-transferase